MSDRKARRDTKRAQERQQAKQARNNTLRLHPLSGEYLRAEAEVKEIAAAFGPWLIDRPFADHMSLEDAVTLGLLEVREAADSTDFYITKKGRKYQASVVIIDFADGPFPVVEIPR